MPNTLNVSLACNNNEGLLSQLFCENRIAAYDETTETGITPLFNIEDTIYVSAEAWVNVIRGCWIKTGILPNNYFNTNLASSQPKNFLI